MNQSFGDCTKSTNYNWYNRHFHVLQFFPFPSLVEVLIPLFVFFQLYSVVNWDSKGHNPACYLFFFCWLLLGPVVWLKLGDPFVCQYPFSRTDAGLFIYHLFLWSNFIFLHNSQWIPLLTQSCQLLCSFCANLLHSLNMGFIASSLSPQNLHLLFCCILSILALLSLWRCFVLTKNLSIYIAQKVGKSEQQAWIEWSTKFC